jgi:AcrR family transcriptional regulator
MESTWAERDLPLLRAIVEFFDDPDHYQLRIPELTRLSGPAEQDVQRALRALADASPPYLKTPPPPEELTYPVIITGMTERARRAVGQWPTAEVLLDQITRGIAEASDREGDPQKKRRLRDAAVVVGETARDVVADVIARIVERQAGLG